LATQITLSKYCDTDTALKILHSQSLRWSAPHLFGDPFEPDYTLKPEIDFETVHRSLVRHVVTSIFNDNKDGPPSSPLMATIQRWREREQFTDEEEAEPIIRNLLEPIVRNQWQKLTDYYQAWSNYAKRVRIACFSNKPNNMASWQRHAANHHGLVLEFHAGHDTQLVDPEIVTYDETPPVLTTLREQLINILGKNKSSDERHFRKMHFHKNKLDGQIKELRCIKMDTEADQGDDPDAWYSYYKFPSSELKAVYFGVNISDEKRRQIAKLLKEKFPLTKLFQAKRVAGKYDVEFTSWRVED
jgi:hypothetical protein